MDRVQCLVAPPEVTTADFEQTPLTTVMTLCDLLVSHDAGLHSL